MDPTTAVNERVKVIASYGEGKHGPTCLPVRMKYKNQVISFTKLALRHPTTKGQRMIHVFDMSDGTNDYRLEFDAEGLVWTLVAILEGSHATTHQ